MTIQLRIDPGWLAWVRRQPVAAIKRHVATAFGRRDIRLRIV